MAKVKSAWFCTSCGFESAKWLGRCPSCGEWNTFNEAPSVKNSKDSKTISRSRSLLGVATPKPALLKDISSTEGSRISIGNTEIERVLGGGLVEGSMVLLGGEPGIGKSTLSLQIPIECPNLKTLYVSGEESPRQIKLRAERLAQRVLLKDDDAANTGRTSTLGDKASNKDNIAVKNEIAPNCYILGETLLENILQQSKTVAPELLIIDSIQTIYTDTLDSSAGSVSQVKECAAALLRFAKESGTPVIIIGHITKDGSIAGPKVLEHIVDVVLQFEGNTRHSYRILRGIKNRFGSTDEIAIFEMNNTGLRQISNPSEILTPMHKGDLSGVAVCSMLDGNRPFLIEIQALVSTAAYGVPRRSATGFDYKRLNMLLAVLEKRAGFKLSSKDVFLNIAGGMKANDPGCDLAVVCSILSSNFDLYLSPKICFAAEIGLSGEIRPVNQIDRRISEAERLGYEKIYISSYNLSDSSHSGNSRKNLSRNRKIEVVEVSDIGALTRSVFAH